jgi:hypothetical protein
MLSRIDFPGKPIESRTCQLDFWITPVIVVDNQVYPATQIQQTFGTDLNYKLNFFSDLMFNIMLDQQIIFQTTFQKLSLIHLTKIIDDQISKGYARILDEDLDPQIGKLVEIDLPDHGKQKFIFAKCGTGRDVAVMADKDATTILEAQAASYGLKAQDFIIPETRT